MKKLTVTEFARLGGFARARKLSPERLSEIGRKAVAVRIAKYGQKKKVEGQQ